LDHHQTINDAHLLLLELVEAEDFDTLRPLLGGEPLARTFQLLEHLLDGDVLLHRQNTSGTTIDESKTLQRKCGSRCGSATARTDNSNS
jgi:hypothetical protein